MKRSDLLDDLLMKAYHQAEIIDAEARMHLDSLGSFEKLTRVHNRIKEVAMGGKPSKGTRKDKRLKKNKRGKGSAKIKP